MFGSTLALAGAYNERTQLVTGGWLLCDGPPDCTICEALARGTFEDWAKRQRARIDEDLQELYETPMSMPQMRSLFRIYPHIEMRARLRTRPPKIVSALRHKGP